MQTSNRPTVSIILLAYDALHDIQRCLGSLLDLENPGYDDEFIAVDNASSDSSVEYIAAYFPDIQLIRSVTNLGFGSGKNLGAQYTNGEYLILLLLAEVASWGYATLNDGTYIRAWLSATAI